jgi:hypothetical protein
MDWRALRTKLQTLKPHEVAAHYTYRGLNRLAPLDIVRVFCLTPRDVRAGIVRAGDVECRWLDAARLRQEADGGGSGVQASDVEKGLARGDRCFGVLVGGVLANHAWYTSRPAQLRPGIDVHFDASYAYSRWTFTRREYRGRRLHALGKRCALDDLARQGLRGILSVVAATNFESLRSASWVGSRPIGLMVAATLGGKARLWSSAGCRRYGVGLETVDE